VGAAAPDRSDPVALLQEQDASREPDLVPVRHGRMLVSPFTFYRGAARIMAEDLKDTPTAGLDAQLCGDAHLSNFGASASPRSSSRCGTSRPPLASPPDAMERVIREHFRAYRATLPEDRRQLPGAVRAGGHGPQGGGVGSVGTQAFIVLLQGRDQKDPLFLQVKEATASVLEGHLPASRYKQHGERVVYGQRMLQAASDIFLGWSKAKTPTIHHFYWRQLRDMKGSADVEAMKPIALGVYAHICGWTLARAHARSGDPIAIAAYLGEDDQFDRSIAAFSERYADHNERDYQAFVEAIRSGRLQALEGV
jgi:uncharacterized protein (DUF2252 family)